MSDIVLIKRRDRVYVITESERGKRHMLDNYIGFDNYYNAPVDVTGELLKDFETNKLEVEQR